MTSSTQLLARAVREGRLWNPDFAVPDDLVGQEAERTLRLFMAAAQRKSEESKRRERARILAMAMQIIDAERVDARPTVREVVRAVQDHFGITTVEMQSGRKPLRLARARQVAMYLAKKYTGATHREIGGPMGGRDPTTCYHGSRAIELRLAAGDDKLAADIAEIKQALNLGGTA